MKEPEPDKPQYGIPESDLPAHSPDGVDLTLIRWMLSLTPGERLQVLQDHVRAVMEIRARNEN